MHKQLTKPIFIETLRMWNWSQRVSVDSQGEGAWRGGRGSGARGKVGGTGAGRGLPAPAEWSAAVGPQDKRGAGNSCRELLPRQLSLTEILSPEQESPGARPRDGEGPPAWR